MRFRLVGVRSGQVRSIHPTSLRLNGSQVRSFRSDQVRSRPAKSVECSSPSPASRGEVLCGDQVRLGQLSSLPPTDIGQMR